MFPIGKKDEQEGETDASPFHQSFMGSLDQSA